MIKKNWKSYQTLQSAMKCFYSSCQINMPLRRTEKLSSYFTGTAYLNRGEFSVGYSEMQEGKQMAAHEIWQGMWSHADRWARWPVNVS